MQCSDVWCRKKVWLDFLDLLLRLISISVKLTLVTALSLKSFDKKKNIYTQMMVVDRL